MLKAWPLIREVIIRAYEVGDIYKVDESGFRFMTVLIDEISRADKTDIYLPSTKDARLLKVMQELTKRPSTNSQMEAMAELACVSSRTHSPVYF